MTEYIKKINRIIKWAENKKGKPFDTSFCKSVKDFIENSEENEPTNLQKNAIDNIIEKFKII